MMKKEGEGEGYFSSVGNEPISASVILTAVILSLNS